MRSAKPGNHLNLPDGQVNFCEEFNLQKNREINSAHQKIFGLVEMTFGLDMLASACLNGKL